nr:hypothetical protein [Tanacetum cinerariifolium]
AGPNGVPNGNAYPASANSFRYAINPPGRKAAANLLDSVLEVGSGELEGCPTRPCPQAISVDDPGIFVVNYRHEPVGLRVYDPNRTAPDGKPGMQANGLAGDLAYALGPTGGITQFPPHINRGGDMPGDPFTPMLRTYTGDNVRLRLHAGGHEEEHNVTLH